MDIVLPHVHRWRTFSLCASLPGTIHDVLTVLDTVDSAPELTRLSVHLSSNCVEHHHFRREQRKIHSRYVPFGGQAPKLRCLELERVNLNWNQCAFMWGPCLSRLQLHYHNRGYHRPSNHDFVRLFRGAQHLEDLDIIHSGLQTAGLMEVLELPSLRRLTIGAFLVGHAVHMLHYLSLPRLTSITLLGSHE